MVKKGINILSFLFLIILLEYCSPDKSQNQNYNDEFLILNEESNIDTAKEKISYFRFPSPEEMLQYISVGNISYSVYMLQPVSNAEDYLDSYSQGINLGIYIADLAYVVLFEKLKDAQNYLKVVEYLSSKLNLEMLFDDNLKSRIRSNLENIDSVSVIAKDTYNKLVKHLDQTQNDYVLATISAGAYVEALHLALEQIDEYQAGNPMMIKVFEQQYAFENLILYIDNIPENKNLNNLQIQLKQIYKVFKEVRFSSTTEATRINSDGVMELGGTVKKFDITKANFNKLKQVVNSVRNEFTSSI